MELHARHDSRELTRPARQAFLAKFDREVDPDAVLPEAERLRRADLTAGRTSRGWRTSQPRPGGRAGKRQDPPSESEETARPAIPREPDGEPG